MAEVKWIKIVTDIFDDEKIRLIEELPDGYAVIVAWFKLLCLAGKQNNSGVFIMNNKIPYTDEMLSVIFRMKKTIIQMALETFKMYEMIEIVNNTITIPNWSKHQTLDQLENKKEYMKEYMQQYREKQKLLASGKDVKNCKTNSKTNSKTNVSSLDKEIDIDIDIDKSIYTTLTNKSIKHKYGTYNNVLLTEDEYQKLVSIADGEQAIQYMSEYLEMKGVKYKSHYLAIKKWVFDAIREKKQKNGFIKQKKETPEWHDKYRKELDEKLKEREVNASQEKTVELAKELFE